MIVLKANQEIGTVFKKVIKTMGENVNWQEIFIINNNDLILVGKGRSLFFNFDTKRAGSNLVDLAINKEKAQEMGDNQMLQHALNMILYAFGKWGRIKGLKVEKDFSQLNGLFAAILKGAKIEPAYSEEHFRFYQDGIMMTYEEVIQAILDQEQEELKKEQEEAEAAKEEEQKKKEKEEAEEKKKAEEEEHQYKIGLWHDMIWTKAALNFHKEPVTDLERKKHRLGHDFYLVNYKCPKCNGKLHMVVYPAGKEMRIETDENGVFIARAYTCGSCMVLYTPRPQKLIMEGDIYTLEFEEDRVAYEDYLAVLGKRGKRISNSNFNAYEWDYHANGRVPEAALGSETKELASMTDQEVEELADKMDSGFYTAKSVEQYQETVEEEREKREKRKKKERNLTEQAIQQSEKKVAGKKEGSDLRGGHGKDNTIPVKKNEGQSRAGKSIVKEETKTTTSVQPGGTKHDSDKITTGDRNNQHTQVKDNLEDKTNPTIDRATVKNTDSTAKKENEKNVNEKNADATIKKVAEEITNSSTIRTIDNTKKRRNLRITGKVKRGKKVSPTGNKISMIPVGKRQEHGSTPKEVKVPKNERSNWSEKVKEASAKNYTEIGRLLQELAGSGYQGGDKPEIQEALQSLRIKQGEQEVRNLLAKLPVTLSQTQYQGYQEKIREYKEVDTAHAGAVLLDRRRNSEKLEIEAVINKAKGNKRKDFMDLLELLKGMKVSRESAAPYVDKLTNELRQMDEQAIRTICPAPEKVSFAEGIAAYEEISKGDFISELKAKYLERIDKRLTRIKSDEWEQLVGKIQKDMALVVLKDARVYFCDRKKLEAPTQDDDEAILIQNARNTYATTLGKYEYPILVCDSTHAATGKKGFLLTPDRIFYNGTLSSGIIRLEDVEEIVGEGGALSKGIFVKLKNKEKEKISNTLKLENLDSFVRVLNNFAKYLKEKPKSRELSYLSKETHHVKCCYRCGYTFEKGSVCPKCGAQNVE